MSRRPRNRPTPHLVLPLVGCLCVILVLVAAGTANAASPAAARRTAAVALAVPSPGDVSYAMVRVRLAPGQRLTMPAGLAGAVSIFSDHVGGLAIRARAKSWRTLRATTRAYVVVSKAQGAPADERDVALFVVRRTGHRGGAGAQVAFTVGNARAVVGSYWVHGVDRSGYADVFHARNIFTTAIANWKRYTLALKLADAMKAALHPRVHSVRPAESADMTTAGASHAASRKRNSGPWTGGQPADARVKAMYGLLLGALHGPAAWGAFKGSPAVPSFIAGELHNRALAHRWRTVVEKVPAIVPDKYAALAQEEKRFAHVSAPQLTHRMVTIADPGNSSTTLQSDVSTAHLQYLTINNPDSAHEYGGTVQVTSYHWDDAALPTIYGQTCDVRICSFAYAPDSARTLIIESEPNDGAAVLSLTGCDVYNDDGWGTCFTAPSETTTTITERFAQSVPLTVKLAPAGSIRDTSDADPYWSCFSAPSCAESLALGQTVTFTASPGGAAPTSWTGCDQPSGSSCTITMTGPRTVNAFLGYALTTTVQAAVGSGGTVTSAGGQIDCGEVPSGVTPACSTNIEAGQMVVLTALADPQSTFSSWTRLPERLGRHLHGADEPGQHRRGSVRSHPADSASRACHLSAVGEP